MCCQFPVLAELGGPKGYIEVAETYRQRGHHVDLVGINQIVGSDSIEYHEAWRLEHFSSYLKAYILKHAHQYDVIEYEAIYLPYNLKEQVKSILVARSVLLELHFLKIKLPVLKTFKAQLSHFLKASKRESELKKRIEGFLTAMKYADVVNVSNPDDKNILIEYGIDKEKIVMQPYGISQKRYDQLNKAHLNTDEKRPPKIAFVGSFDRRKGAVEFPSLAFEIKTAFPSVVFKLMGVLGLFRSSQDIFKYFGPELKDNVEVIEKYNPDALPDLLKDCSIGIFPSHLESFGFGVLEMMSGGLPVVGYRAPGTSMLLPDELLVPIGDHSLMAKKIIRLLNSEEERKRYSEICSNRAKEFIYENQKNLSLEKYQGLIIARE